MSATYLEWPHASPLVACTWAVAFGESGEAHVDRIIPDGCVDLLWTGRGLTIAGPDTTSSTVDPWPNGRIVGVRLRPGVAPTLFGVPTSELRDQRVDADLVLGARVVPVVDALADRLRETRSASGVAAILAKSMLGWRSFEPDPLVLRATTETGSISAIAKKLGVSDRQLRRRFIEAVGYAPKTFQRIQRLRRFIVLAREKRSLVDIALGAGYADQSHLTREVRALTGATPTELAGYPVTTS